MPGNASLVDLLTTQCVAGRTTRGIVFAAAGAAFLATGVLFLMRLTRPMASDSWAVGFAVATALGLAGIALAWEELRRPVRFGVSGRARDRAIQRSSLRWHPSIEGVIDLYDETHTLAPMDAGFGLIGAVIGAAREVATGTMRVKVLLVDSPLRIGETARVEFRAAWHRGSLHGTVPKFHLRCLREDPSGFRGFATRVDTLADLVPHRTEIAGERKNVNLSLAFDLPPGLPGSDLLAARPVYWVLDVEMSIPLTFHFRKRYFLPVEGAAAVTSASRPALATRPVSS